MGQSLMMFILLIISSCAHENKNLSVEFPVEEELFQEIILKSKNYSSSPVDSQRSNRRIYFSSLYYQYKMLAAGISKGSSLEFCPQFHHDKIEVDEQMLGELKLVLGKNTQGKQKNVFSEEIFKSESSFMNYFNQIESEIKELCENGYSDNFYKFDNLIVYHVIKKDFHTKFSSMKAVLKIPIFANYYLLKMQQNSTDVMNTFALHSSFIERSKTYWFNEYVHRAHKKREKYLVNN